MHDSQLTRRRALGLGAAALAAASSFRPAAALAAPRPASFELDLTGKLGGGRAHAAGWRTLPPLRAPRRFDVFGLDFPAGARVHAQVRARRRGGPWSRWTTLHTQGDHGPDGAATPTGTDPCWTDSADVFQVRIKGDPRRLKARFVRAKPAATTARRLHASAVARASRRGSAAQAGAPPAIIPRSAWGGDALPPKETPLIGQVQAGFVHHTDTTTDYAPGDSAAIVLGICRYHRDHNGWNDIGYNFLVDKYGQVFEGRAGGIDQAIVGAHAEGYNSFSTGVACLGTYTGAPFPAAGLEAVARLLAWKLPLHAAPVTGTFVVTSTGGASNRYKAGTSVTLNRISGHRDGDSTECPGAALYAQLPALRARVAELAVPISALTITPSATSLRSGQALTLTGILRFGDGSSPADCPVQLQYQVAGGAWELVDTVQTAADGTWAATMKPPVAGRVRAVFPGDETRAPVTGAAVRIRVSPNIKVALSSASVLRGRRIRVSGTVGPSWPTQVQLLLERHTGRGVVRVQRKKVRVRRGRFGTYVRLPRKGRYRLSVSGQGTTTRRKLRAR